MSLVILILAGTALLAGMAAGILVLLTIGIRQGDHAHLADTPRSHPDSIARRVLTGVRYPSESEEDEDE
jgi:hypothetical protein